MFLLRLLKKLIQFVRNYLAKRLFRLRSRMRMDSLREAIGKADDLKKDTGRKAIVVFDNPAGKYDALTKRTLKAVTEKRKIKGQPAQTAYRKKHPVKKSPGRFTVDRVKMIEKKSAYVTK